jgi:NAD(P)-dependent dehydrogenase (short-subunit alcohol dehydrogenase family)
MTTSYDDNAQIALVTGANRGLGLAVARRLGEAGATVLIGGRDAANAEHAAESLREDGLKAWPVPLDVTVEADAAAVAEQIEREYGRLDILVNNAGVLPEATAPDQERPLDLAMFRRTFETNLFGVVAVTQAMLPLLRRSRAGRIVNVSTTMGSLTEQLDPRSPYFGLVVPAYQGSKAALNALTIALSKSLADTSILVNSDGPRRARQPRRGAHVCRGGGPDRDGHGTARGGRRQRDLRRRGRSRRLVTGLQIAQERCLQPGDVGLVQQRDRDILRSSLVAQLFHDREHVARNSSIDRDLAEELDLVQRDVQPWSS